MFIKRCDSFEQGMRALLSVSQDLAEMFGPLRRNPHGWYITSEAHVRAWLGARPLNRGTGVGVGWTMQHYGNRYGVAYRTGCGLVFGWRYFPGLLGEVANEPPLFFLGGPLGEHPAGWSPVELPGSLAITHKYVCRKFLVLN